MTTRPLCLIILLLAALALRADDPAAPASAGAAQAKKVYEQQLAWADGQYKQAVADAKKKMDAAAETAKAEYLLKLKALLDTAMTAKKLDEANRIDAELKRLAETTVKPGWAVQSATRLEEVEGKWNLTYTDGSRRLYQLDRNGTATMIDMGFPEGGRVTVNKKGRVFWRPDQVLIEFGDGVLERITLARDGSAFVERWEPRRLAEKKYVELMAVATRSK